MPGSTAPAGRLFELRTYHVAPGKLEALRARFRDHTFGIFARLGLEVVAFFEDAPGGDRGEHLLVYLLAFEDRNHAERAWAAFRADPEWLEVKAETERDGALTSKVDSLYLQPTEHSPLR
ncbi:MAG: NIPSNAP family protein [Actinomycetota bacterium]|nr:NIPSNAP family protein [Actinomycetota bacterium]